MSEAEQMDSSTDSSTESDASARDDGPRQVMPSASALDALARDDESEDADASDGEGKSKPRASKDKDKEKPVKFKVKRGGAEREMTLEDAIAELSDDYEHTFKVGSAEKKMRRRDIERAVQLSEGAMEKMREAAERRKEFESRDAFLKQDPWSYLERFGGVQSHEQMVMQRAHEILQEQADLEQLAKQNPYAYNQRMREKVENDIRRKQAYDAAQERAAYERMQRERGAKEYESTLSEAFRGAGVPLNEHTKLIAARIWGEHHEVGHNLSPQDIADMTREAWEREVLGYLDARDDDAIVRLLGDKRRERLRKLELAAVKRGASKPANDNGTPSRQQAQSNGAAKHMSEGAFLKSL